MKTLTLFTLLFLAGCSSIEKETAGFIGCPENEIKVLDINRSLSSANWTVQCRGKTFYCSSVTYGNTQASCKEELK